MSDFVEAIQTNNVTTKNGMTTNSSTLNDCVNLFFSIGAMRGKVVKGLISLFSKAFNEDPRTAMRILFWSRDVRGGAGERQIFRDILSYLVENHTDAIRVNLDLVPEYGRWDDIQLLFGSELEGDVITLIVDGLKKNNGLCAKWMPRKGEVFNKVRKSFGVTPKELRKLIVYLSDTVEQKMCSSNWDKIDYSKLPSLAMSRYSKAFNKNDNDRFSKYKEELIKGNVKINAGAVYPYDVIKSLKMGDAELASEQWNALPNYMEGSDELILPVVDVSGSMSCSAGNSANLTCMDVAVSLGIYISERNRGVFKDMFVTFSDTPTVQKLVGTLKERVSQLTSSDWAMSTDLEATFNMLLQQAIKHSVLQEDMPTKILILSDMEFNQATGEYWGDNSRWTPTAMEMIRQKYQEHGYEVPSIIFWNINSSGSNFPTRFNETGTALVSGFSPSIMTSLISGGDVSPIAILGKTVNSERYEPITV